MGLPVNHCNQLINLQLTVNPAQTKYHPLKSWKNRIPNEGM